MVGATVVVVVVVVGATVVVVVVVIVVVVVGATVVVVGMTRSGVESEHAAPTSATARRMMWNLRMRGV